MFKEIIEISGTKKNTALGVVFAMIATITIFAPYHGDSTLGNEWLRSFLLYTVYVLSACAVILFAFCFKKREVKFNFVLASLSIIIFFLLNVFHSYTEPSYNFLTTILWILFCLSPNGVKLCSFVIFKKIWVFLCVIGIICYIAYVLNIPIPYRELPYYFSVNGLGVDLKYVDYGVSFLYKEGNILRLCGFCNEPGLFGTFCGLILCASCLKLKERKNIIIFIAGALSFSLAFFMIICLYILLRILLRIKCEKDLVKKVACFVAVILVPISVFFVLPNIKTGDYMIDSTLKRLSFTESGLSGNNRTNQKFDALYNSASFNEKMFGYGRGYLKSNNYTRNLSYKVYFIEYGFFWCIIFWGALLIAAICSCNKDSLAILFVIVFFANIYQRPGIMSIDYIIILLGGICYISNMKKELQKHAY